MKGLGSVLGAVIVLTGTALSGAAAPPLLPVRSSAPQPAPTVRAARSSGPIVGMATLVSKRFGGVASTGHSRTAKVAWPDKRRGLGGGVQSSRLEAPLSTANASSLQPTVSVGPNDLQLLSQTAWVGAGHDQFRLQLKVTARDPAKEMLAVVIYSELTTRSELQATLSGYFPNVYDTGIPPVPLGALHKGPAGGADMVIPVNSASGSLPLSTTGVYPVQVFLEQGGVRQGPALTTFLVYAGPGAAHLQRLNAAMVVPLSSNTVTEAPGGRGTLPLLEASELRADLAVLSTSRAPVTIQAGVQTVEALDRSGPAGRLAVTDLRRAVSGGDELLPATSFPVNLPALVSAGLASDVEKMVSAGDATLGALAGTAPSASTWAFPGGVDAAAMAVLEKMGARRVVVPEADLSTLPPAYQQLTFAQPTELDVGTRRVEVIGADGELSASVDQASALGQPALVANHVLAELAMIDLEAPSDVRGVVLLPPGSSPVDPTFLSVLLAGLSSDPLVAAVTVAGEFKAVPRAPGPSGAFLVRQLGGPVSSAPLMGIGQLRRALVVLSDDAAVYGPGSPTVSTLGQGLLASLSSALSAPQRQAMIAGLSRAASSELTKVRLPPPASITLTSRQGRLPLTVLSGAGVPARVRLVLSSEELSFVEASFSAGKCRPVNAGSEDCELTLDHATTTLQVPVVVRTSGAFQLSLELETPDGARAIEASTDTVRSTAISDVGLALMLSAALFLAAWWVHNSRHGRRARRLVPQLGGDGTSGAGRTAG